MKHLKSTVALLFLIFCLQNTFATDYYWVGGTNAAWASLTSWSYTSGGGSHPIVVPGSTDRVIFDGNGGLTSTSNILIPNGIELGGLEVRSTAPRIRFSSPGGTGSATIYGSFIFERAVNYFIPTTYFKTLTTGATYTISVASGSVIDANPGIFEFDGNANWDVIGDLTMGVSSNNVRDKIIITRGNVDFGSGTIYISSLQSVGNGLRTINLSSSTFELRKNSSAWIATGSNITLNAGLSHLKFIHSTNATTVFNSFDGAKFNRITNANTLGPLMMTGNFEAVKIHGIGDLQLAGNLIMDTLILESSTKHLFLANGTQLINKYFFGEYGCL